MKQAISVSKKLCSILLWQIEYYFIDIHKLEPHFQEENLNHKIRHTFGEKDL